MLVFTAHNFAGQNFLQRDDGACGDLARGGGVVVIAPLDSLALLGLGDLGVRRFIIFAPATNIVFLA